MYTVDVPTLSFGSECMFRHIIFSVSTSEQKKFDLATSVLIAERDSEQ